ncbi:hypothetical protein ACJX0J_020634, partial [Zea mays]
VDGILVEFSDWIRELCLNKVIRINDTPNKLQFTVFFVRILNCIFASVVENVFVYLYRFFQLINNMADEEVTDPKAFLEERSKAKCVSQWYEYQKCVKRIENDETGHKHCTGQYFDYWKCVDKN